ncbi:MAG: DUF1992 domain-containing protein [Anaerolineales bacterium]|jgi:hypothetical protein|nr:DUF1992 domain-containing protein [Anaerolineales bacterium]
MPNIDEIIRKAMDAGAFDNLRGAGKPLRLEDNPYVEPDWQLAYHLLKENGFAPAFIEVRQAIEQDLAAGRARLAENLAWRTQAGQAGMSAAFVAVQWQQAQQQFGDLVAQLNQRIRDYNLTVGHVQLTRALIDAAREAAAICQPGDARG